MHLVTGKRQNKMIGCNKNHYLSPAATAVIIAHSDISYAKPATSYSIGSVLMPVIVVVFSLFCVECCCCCWSFFFHFFLSAAIDENALAHSYHIVDKYNFFSIFSVFISISFFFCVHVWHSACIVSLADALHKTSRMLHASYT